MALPIQRIGDSNDGGGIITSTPQSTVYVNGLLVAVDGSIGTSHDHCKDHYIHCEGQWQTIGGSPNVYIEGIPVNRTGDVDTCGHVRVGGSGNVFVP